MDIRPQGFSSIATDLRAASRNMEDYRGKTHWGESLGSGQLDHACNDFSNNWSVQVSVTEFRMQDFADACDQVSSAMGSDEEQVANLLDR